MFHCKGKMMLDFLLWVMSTCFFILPKYAQTAIFFSSKLECLKPSSQECVCERNKTNLPFNWADSCCEIFIKYFLSYSLQHSEQSYVSFLLYNGCAIAEVITQQTKLRSTGSVSHLEASLLHPWNLQVTGCLEAQMTETPSESLGAYYWNWHYWAKWIHDVTPKSECHTFTEDEF